MPDPYLPHEVEVLERVQESPTIFTQQGLDLRIGKYRAVPADEVSPDLTMAAMTDAAAPTGQAAEDLSFTHAIRVLHRRLPAAGSIPPSG